jgi:hypothetical protein
MINPSHRLPTIQHRTSEQREYGICTIFRRIQQCSFAKITASEVLLMVRQFPNPVASGAVAKALGDVWRNQCKDCRQMWLSRFKNAKMIGVYFSSGHSNPLMRISEQSLDSAGCKF